MGECGGGRGEAGDGERGGSKGGTLLRRLMVAQDKGSPKKYTNVRQTRQEI